MAVQLLVIPEHTNSKFLKVRDDGTIGVDSRAIIEHSARVAGECYDQEGWDKLSVEPADKTKRREERTLGPDDGSGVGNEHATPYEHVQIGLQVIGPKILMMLLNNEQQCSTSEKSARYTVFRPENGVSERETALYDKWMGNIYELIRKDYVDDFWKVELRKAGQDAVKAKLTTETRMKKLAQENARYLTSVFTQTFMIHTVPWIQWNRIASMMIDFTARPIQTPFEQRLAEVLQDFVRQLECLGILDQRAMSNRKQRRLRLFTSRQVETYFGDVYSTSYRGSFAQLAQAHRHRTIDYNMLLPEEPGQDQAFYVPPVLPERMHQEWLADMASVGEFYPQGQLIQINERGTLEAFIAKMKERLCYAAQLEIQQQTVSTLRLYHAQVGKWLDPYTKGARCTFPDYTCPASERCFWEAGIKLTRTI